MIRATSTSIRLLQDMAGRSTHSLLCRASLCKKHQHLQVTLSSSNCSSQRIHTLPLIRTSLSKLSRSSMRALNTELLESSLLRSSFHTGSCYFIQKQERTDGSSKQKVESQNDGASNKSILDVPQQVLELSDENNESLGSMPRDEAIQMSKDKKMKLVLVNPNSQPYPTYRLMSQDDYESEQSRKKENLQKKLKVREVRLTCGIGEHDLDVKRRQLNKWFDDPKYDTHVKVVVKGGKTFKPVSEKEQLDVVHKLISGLKNQITFENKPKLAGKNNPSLTVQLRLMSVKEKAKYNKQKNTE